MKIKTQHMKTCVTVTVMLKRKYSTLEMTILEKIKNIKYKFYAPRSKT